MAIHSAVGANQVRPRQPAIQSARLPAPAGGIDTRVPAAEMAPQNSIYSYNMVSAEYGLKIRSGYREWVTGLEQTPSTAHGVHTLITFDDNIAGTDGSRLFAVTREGILDVTNSTDSPTMMQAFANTGAGAGYGTYINYVDQAGSAACLYADELNGLWVYEPSVDPLAWSRPSSLTGPTAEDIAFITLHKQRIWMIEQNSSSAWYLPVGSKSGQATEFFFGTKFKHGGTLRGLYNWSVDGGAGVDDYLVAISGAGDVIPYKGEDPSSADTWYSVGMYYIGTIPKGRGFASEYVGQLYILSSFGLIAMSDLLRGVDMNRETEDSLTYKIALPLRRALAETSDSYGWCPTFLPQLGTFIIVEPHETTSSRPTQWVQTLATQGWGMWRDIPLTTIVEWHGKTYFGTDDNRVCVMDVTRDNVRYDTLAEDASGEPIKFSVLSSFQDYGQPTQFKIAQFVRPDFYTLLMPPHQVQVLYDYDTSEVAYFNPVTQQYDAAIWDSGIWNDAAWTSGDEAGASKLSGEAGMGRTMAVAILGETVSDTRLLSFDVMWKAGGIV